MTLPITGSCLCGAVRYEITAEPAISAHCHCIDCRKASGTGHGSHMVVPENAFALAGKVAEYAHPADSGNIVTRCFCPTCGCAVYSFNSGMPGVVFPRASSLDDPENFRPMAVVYADRAPSWDRMDPALPSFGTMSPPEEMQKMMGGS